MGLHIAQMALLGGADDAGSTMMEENVVSASGTSKLDASELELQSAILRAGFTPQRRDRLCSLGNRCGRTTECSTRSATADHHVVGP